MSVSHPALATTTFIILLAIHSITFVYLTTAYFTKPKPLHSEIKWAIFWIWILTLGLFLCSGFRINREGVRKIALGQWNFRRVIMAMEFMLNEPERKKYDNQHRKNR